MSCSSRLLDADVGETEVKKNEQKNDSEITKLYEKSVFPRFVIRPADTYIIVNQTGIIEARISGVTEPKPIVKWYKNGQLITESQYPRMKMHHYVPDTYVLEIQDAITEDMGSYTCVARNCYGRMTSSATVRIIDLEIKEYPRSLKRLQSIDVFAGKNGRLEVRVAGEPKPEVKWFKNCIPLNENEGIEIQHYEPYSYVLNIKNVKPEDSGLYTCQARNDTGTSSTSAMVHVEGNEDLYIKPLAASEDRTRIRRHLERRKCPDNWSQKQMDDLLHQIAIANYHMKYRIPSAFYNDLFS